MSPSFQRVVPYQIFRCTASLELKLSRATPFTFRREMNRTTGRVTSTRAVRASERVPERRGGQHHGGHGPVGRPGAALRAPVPRGRVGAGREGSCEHRPDRLAAPPDLDAHVGGARELEADAQALVLPVPVRREAGGSTTTPPSVRSTTTVGAARDLLRHRTRPRPRRGSSRRRQRRRSPSSRPRLTLRGPAGRSALASSVRASAPEDAFTTLTATTARRESRKETVERSALQSPFGVRTRGETTSPVTASGGGPGTRPAAGRVSGPALISYVYEAIGAALASHVQSTAVPLPVPCATTAPPASLTRTSQATRRREAGGEANGPAHGTVDLGVVELRAGRCARRSRRSRRAARRAPCPGSSCSRCRGVPRPPAGAPRGPRGSDRCRKT